MKIRFLFIFVLGVLTPFLMAGEGFAGERLADKAASYDEILRLAAMVDSCFSYCGKDSALAQGVLSRVSSTVPDSVRASLEFAVQDASKEAMAILKERAVPCDDLNFQLEHYQLMRQLKEKMQALEGGGNGHLPDKNAEGH